jgi:hypothetical protein
LKVADDLTIKISDYGLCKPIKSADDHYSSKDKGDVLPIRWCAPEVLNKRIHPLAADVWAFGILLWEIFSMGKTPYPKGWTNNKVQEKITKEQYRMEMPEQSPPQVQLIMQACWQHKPKFRPRMVEILDCFKTSKVGGNGKASIINLTAEPSWEVTPLSEVTVKVTDTGDVVINGVEEFMRMKMHCAHFGLMFFWLEVCCGLEAPRVAGGAVVVVVTFYTTEGTICRPSFNTRLHVFCTMLAFCHNTEGTRNYLAILNRKLLCMTCSIRV